MESVGDDKDVLQENLYKTTASYELEGLEVECFTVKDNLLICVNIVGPL